MDSKPEKLAALLLVVKLLVKLAQGMHWTVKGSTVNKDMGRHSLVVMVLILRIILLMMMMMMMIAMRMSRMVMMTHVLTSRTP